MEGIENFPDEEWKDIPGYEGKYKVSNYGRVYSFNSKKILKENISEGTVRLGVKQVKLNKLVYIVFVDNSKTLCGSSLRVSCIDGNVHNHYYKNLYINSVEKYIGKVINGKYTIIGFRRIKNNKQFTIKCDKCNDIINTSRNINSILTNPNFKCSCYYKYNIGDIILNQYIIIDKYIENSRNVYKLQCQVCGDIITRGYISYSNKKYFECSCSQGKKYHVGNIYNGLLILDTISRHGFVRYHVQCVKCGCTKWVQGYAFKNENGIKCSCYQTARYIDGRCGTKQYIAWHSMRSRCNNKRYKAYENIFICNFWNNDFLNFKSWYDEQIKKYSLDKYDIPEWVFNESKKRKEVNKFLNPSVDRIDPRYEYAPYNCQIIPWYINSVLKKHADMNRSEKQLKIDELKFKRRKRNWIKEMVKKGYKREDLI